jgi:signal transduction histidine kinase
MLQPTRRRHAGYMTTETLTSTTDSATLEPVKGNLYLRLWRGVPRELGFLLLALPIATLGFGSGLILMSGGAGTVVTFFIGVFLFIGLFYVSRAFGTVELIRLGWAGRPAVARPHWSTDPGFWGWLRSMFTNGHYWLYVLHTTIVNYVVSLVSWTVTVVWLATGLGGVTHWFWGYFLPSNGRNPGNVSRWLFDVFGDRSVDWSNSGLNFAALDSVVFAVLGVAFLATLPFITHVFVLLHDVIARTMLGAFPSDDLKRQVRELNASRSAAVAAEGHSLRRLERDIHDGPQQRLVRLQMDIAAAERQLDSDPDAAKALLASAKDQSHEALEELRALSRGFAPPILMDRGLVAALQSLAARSSLTVSVDSQLDDVELSQELQRNAYFVASELLTNAVKHSQATTAKLAVGAHGNGLLDVVAEDDGHGGASVVAGHGLAGLVERLHGLGGTLTISSPVGGPTVITAHLPMGDPANPTD